MEQTTGTAGRRALALTSEHKWLLIGMLASGHLILIIRRFNGPLMHGPYGATQGVGEEISNLLTSGLFIEIPFLVLIAIWLAKLRSYGGHADGVDSDRRHCTAVVALAWVIGLCQGIMLFWPGFNGATGYALTLLAWWPSFAAIGIGFILFCGLVLWPFFMPFIKLLS